MSYTLPIVLVLLAIGLVVIARLVPRSRRGTEVVVGRGDHGLQFARLTVGEVDLTVLNSDEAVPEPFDPNAGNVESLWEGERLREREPVAAGGDRDAFVVDERPDEDEPLEAVESDHAPAETTLSHGIVEDTILVLAETIDAVAGLQLDAEAAAAEEVAPRWEDDGGLPHGVDRMRVVSAFATSASDPLDADVDAQEAGGEAVNAASRDEMPGTFEEEAAAATERAAGAQQSEESAGLAVPSVAMSPMMIDRTLIDSLPVTATEGVDDDSPAIDASVTAEADGADLAVATAEAIVRSAADRDAAAVTEARDGDDDGGAPSGHRPEREIMIATVRSEPSMFGQTGFLVRPDAVVHADPAPCAVADLLLIAPPQPLTPEPVVIVSLNALPDDLARDLDAKLRRYTTYAPPVAVAAAIAIEWTESFADGALEPAARRTLLAEVLELGVDDELLISVFDEDPDVRSVLLSASTLELYGAAVFVHAFSDGAVGGEALDVLVAAGETELAARALAVPTLAAYAATQLMDVLDVSAVLRSLHDAETAQRLIDEAGL